MQFWRVWGREKSATTSRDCNLADGLGPAVRQRPSVECDRPVCGLSAPKMAPSRPRGPKRRPKHGTGILPLNPSQVGIIRILRDVCERRRVHQGPLECPRLAAPQGMRAPVRCMASPRPFGELYQGLFRAENAPKRGLGPPAPKHRRVTRQATVKKLALATQGAKISADSSPASALQAPLKISPIRPHGLDW